MQLRPQIKFQPSDTPQTILTKILRHRGLSNPESQQAFLSPSFPTSSFLAHHLGIAPSLLQTFKQRLHQAKAQHQRICIFGDYDADGLTSTAILWQALNQLGLSVLPFIPHRQRHGYGLSLSAIQEILSGQAFSCHNFKPDLIITTDTGIVAHQEIAYLKQQGVEVIVTDHHQPLSSSSLPPANLVIHTTQTSAAGLAFLLAQTLLGDAQATDLIELATIGVVADQIPLTGANRNLVFHGLKHLQHPTNPGLQALYHQAGLTSSSSITTYTIGFVIAPRLNAMGRLSHGLDALRLLCSHHPQLNQKLAQTLEKTNTLRQDLTLTAFQDALQRLDDASPLNIVASPDYHEGIIGLIAGKLLEQTGKPSLVMSIGSSLVKGSARSTSDLDITQFLRQHQDLLLSVGGHKLAAGFSLLPQNLSLFTRRLHQAALQLSLTPPSDQLVIDGFLHLAQATPQLYHALQQLAPFGLGNPRPLFATQARVASSHYVGSQQQHLQLQLVDHRYSLKAIWFNAPSSLSFSELSTFVFHLDLNSWNQRTFPQLNLKHAF